MEGDALRLHQIVNNLLNNAIKFTPHGGEVRVKLIRGGSSALLSVADTGIGIDTDVLPHIFDRFKQADSSSKRRHGGLGLGLAIVEHLVTLHGGEISVISERGNGSEFIVELPLVVRRNDIAENSSFIAADSDTGDNTLTGLRLLVVEDDPDSLEMLRMTLERGGAKVSGVCSSAEALKALEGSEFDVLISDLGMPEMDGYDLITAVRRELRIDPTDLPALALSGYAGADDRDRSLASGFQTHLAKPLEMSTLVSAIASILPDRRMAESTGK
jgi:CheY-like chemotaxis protein